MIHIYFLVPCNFFIHFKFLLYSSSDTTVTLGSKWSPKAARVSIFIAVLAYEYKFINPASVCQFPTEP